LLISGINFGENVGTSVTNSGTVGAAIEAATFGVPGLAVSVETPQEFHYQHSDSVDFTAAAAFTRRFAQIVLDGGLPAGVDILKIEVPSDATPETPWRIARVSRQRYYVPLPSGRRSLGEQKGISYTRVINWDTLEADSDVRALAVDRVVSVAPLTIDLTARVDLDELAADFQGRDQ
jgi:5'-nucleotidase